MRSKPRRKWPKGPPQILRKRDLANRTHTQIIWYQPFKSMALKIWMHGESANYGSLRICKMSNSKKTALSVNSGWVWSRSPWQKVTSSHYQRDSLGKHAPTPAVCRKHAALNPLTAQWGCLITVPSLLPESWRPTPVLCRHCHWARLLWPVSQLLTGKHVGDLPRESSKPWLAT